MRTLLFIFLFVPVVCFAQSHQTLTFYPATDASDGIAPDTSAAFRIIDFENYYFGGLELPQSFADSLTFLVSTDGSNYFKLNHPHPDSAKEYVIEPDSSQASAVKLPLEAFGPWDFLKVITDVGVGDVTADSSCGLVLERRGSESR